MMKKFIAPALLGLALTLPAGATTFIVTLTGDQESTPSGSPGTGTLTLDLNEATNMIHVDLSWSGLLSATTAAHLHCCNGPGVNAPAVVPFAGFPTGVMSGTYAMDFAIDDATETGILAGMSYVNIHTTQFPGGEIRADLLKPIPEPATYALLSAGLLAIGFATRRRRA